MMPSNVSAQSPPESISGRHFRAIEATLPELQKNNLNVEDYWIGVSESDASIVVSFGFKDAPPSYRGSYGPKPNFYVELDKNDLRVMRLQLIR
jgi:hypothetical protein